MGPVFVKFTDTCPFGEATEIPVTDVLWFGLLEEGVMELWDTLDFGLCEVAADDINSKIQKQPIMTKISIDVVKEPEYYLLIFMSLVSSFLKSNSMGLLQSTNHFQIFFLFFQSPLNFYL